MSRPIAVGKDLREIIPTLELLAAQGVQHTRPVNSQAYDFRYYKDQIEQEERVLRQDFARRLIRDIDGCYGITTTTPSVFLSYSSKAYGKLAEDVAIKEHFKPETGFGDAVTFGDDLVASIVLSIQRADCFIGIWSPEFTVFDIQAIDDSGRRFVRQQGSGPSVWLPFELGVARAFGKPFKLLAPADIHDEINSKITPNTVSVQFSDTANLEERLRGCLSALKKQVAAMKKETTASDFQI